MKTKMWLMGCFTFLLMGSCMAQEKTFKEEVKQNIPIQNIAESRVLVRNIYGSITVEAYSGNEVVIEATKEIWAKTDSKLEEGKTELQLKAYRVDDTVVIRPDSPYITWNDEKLEYQWCNNNNSPKYSHNLDIRVKVPSKINVEVSAINHGEVLVKNTRGDFLKVENINGGITLENVAGTTEVNCINGRVDISYAENPSSNSTYYSLNGDINVTYQASLSANVSFTSMHGELYTDFDIQKQFTKTEKEKDSKGKSRYKYSAQPVVQIGSGALDFSFETLNGNVYIKKI
ncbi:MAG: DUF4097 family beta strand repeat-containing protein [Bacteroidota bacterium]